MKIVCIACGEPAVITDHKFSTVSLMGVDLEIVDLFVECHSCEETLEQRVRTCGLTEEEILSHPRHYTQLP